MLWIDPSGAQVGHIAHGADCERQIKTRHGRSTRRALQRADSLPPPRSVVILGVEPFLPGISEKLDQRQSLRYRLCPLDPGLSEPCWLVELLEPVSIVAEVRPAHTFDVPVRDQFLDVGLLPGAEICRDTTRRAVPHAKRIRPQVTSTSSLPFLRVSRSRWVLDTSLP